MIVVILPVKNGEQIGNRWKKEEKVKSNRSASPLIYFVYVSLNCGFSYSGIPDWKSGRCSESDSVWFRNQFRCCWPSKNFGASSKSQRKTNNQKQHTNNKRNHYNCYYYVRNTASLNENRAFWLWVVRQCKRFSAPIRLCRQKLISSLF